MHRSILIRFFLISLGLTSVCFGQYRGGFASGNSGIVSGGVLHPPNIGALGRPIPNAPGAGAYGRGSRRNGYGYGYGIGAYPVYIGGLSSDYYSGYGDPSLAAGPGTGYAQPPAPAAPAVVINQYFGAPGPGGPGGPSDDPNVQIYSDQKDSAPVSAPEPRTYLIAYQDHSVYSALAYWIEDHTLHYVTTQNTHNQADLSLIDVEFTKKLNQDRNMSFSLTPTQH